MKIKDIDTVNKLRPTVKCTNIGKINRLKKNINI